MSERFRPTPKEQPQKSYFTVYCQDEGRFIYESSGKNKQIERIVAESIAYGHANDLGHKVYIFEEGKKIL
jgi:hypothetical protein